MNFFKNKEAMLIGQSAFLDLKEGQKAIVWGKDPGERIGEVKKVNGELVFKECKYQKAHKYLTFGHEIIKVTNHRFNKLLKKATKIEVLEGAS